MIVKRYYRRPAICAGEPLRDVRGLDSRFQLVAPGGSESIAGVQQFLGVADPRSVPRRNILLINRDVASVGVATRVAPSLGIQHHCQ